MADHSHHAGHAHAHNHAHDHAHGGSLGSYMLVFFILSGLTIVSFAANWAVHHKYLTHAQSFIIILSVACVKAIAVAVIFMHLKWDWKKLYFMIAPAFILAPFFIMALLPDIVLAWKQTTGK